MAQVLIVTYDLSKPGQNYERLIQHIKALGNWARIGYSSYLVATAANPAQVRDYLLPTLDGNDSLYVGLAPPPSAWHGLPDDVARWIHANQK